MDRRPRICDHCKDPRNPVTQDNGGAMLVMQLGGMKRTLAYVHKSCKEAWAQMRGGTTFDGVWPTVEKIARCEKCGKAFEVVGNQGSETRTRLESVSCPYCGQPSEVEWPKNQNFFVRPMPSDM